MAKKPSTKKTVAALNRQVEVAEMGALSCLIDVGAGLTKALSDFSDLVLKFTGCVREVHKARNERNAFLMSEARRKQ